MNEEHDNSEFELFPRVVHIFLKEGFPAEYLAAAFSDVKVDAADVNTAGVPFEAIAAPRSIKNEHGLLRWEPSFAFTPPGLPPEQSPPPDRDRYFTLYFPPAENHFNIADKLNSFEAIDFASAARPIVPPGDPIKEPLVTGPGVGPMSDLKPQWYIQRCHIDSAWRLKGEGQFFSGEGVVVADLDWGFRTTHDEFQGRIERKYNSITGLDFVSVPDRIAHGTGALGILGAASNGSGMAGIAYGASLWAIQAADGTPRIIDFRFWWFAIDFVRRTSSDGRPKVICLEAQTVDDLNIESDLLINKVIRDAIASGVVVCVPAGNGNKNAGRDLKGEEFEPTNSILVGATLFDDDVSVNRKSGLSNWGERVVVSAPGHEDNDVTCGAAADNDYVNTFGRTSGATPKVAATVALMLEANPTLTNAEIRSILKATGTAIADAETTPVGTFLDACAAVRQAQLHNT